ncbi:1,6-anhydro-N-acetylmuramyl-L-alanine amidase AmpD [Thalassotalea castellviae]|uniref:1,6-anhydro-N-acetylmuramyl-L-alanine amidase AmpD n=1 Tax=Thalassotalea castellviae TaxID=3075612 RepID=A0ABU3A1F5_9GAMM|nr:1,6-anhydro-N-acetylmuramyl-L-alanine amidase AmpD [Thalassotalea sp. W431]MDT0603377.1 1,6-anhydro-N-acetylmuramyl-L-alanine amidase AmpD [Thalassotalea sp. W431]
MPKPTISQSDAIMTINQGWLEQAEKCISPHYDQREHCASDEISLLVIHNISLPARQFGGQYISDLFLGRLDPQAHPSFEEIYQLRVSAHCLIRRDGQIIQYVSFNDRAWHAGVSNYQGKEKCNDFSIGIELEGADDIPYTNEQYQQLSQLTLSLITTYPLIAGNITGHCDIAPSRKTDPGDAFDWQKYQQMILNN